MMIIVICVNHVCNHKLVQIFEQNRSYLLLAKVWVISSGLQFPCLTKIQPKAYNDKIFNKIYLIINPSTNFKERFKK